MLLVFNKYINPNIFHSFKIFFTFFVFLNYSSQYIIPVVMQPKNGIVNIPKFFHSQRSQYGTQKPAN